MASVHLMQAFGIATAFLALSGAGANAQDNVTVKNIDPATRIEDLNVGNKSCYIIVRNGKAYEVCNFSLPQEIEVKLKAMESK